MTVKTTNRFTKDQVERILALCKMEGLCDSAEGWRAYSPFRIEEGLKPDGGKSTSLTIGENGLWFCHATQRKGNIVSLYAEMNNVSPLVARSQLKRDGLIDAGYRDPVPDEPKLDEKSERVEKVWRYILDESRLPTEEDCRLVAQWREVDQWAYRESRARGTWRVMEYERRGYTVVFVAVEPPILEGAPQTRSLNMRHINAECKADKWSSVRAYPIWVPWWNPRARKVMLFEGQWDALAFSNYLSIIGASDEMQVMALQQGKDIIKYSEILEYLKGKKVVMVPDRDEAGEGFICQTWEAIQDIAEMRLLRLDSETDRKDFNDWVKSSNIAKPSDEQVLEWLKREDDFCVRSNGVQRVVIDSLYCRQWKVKKTDFFVIDERGAPVVVQNERVVGDEPWRPAELMGWLSPYTILHEYITAAGKIQEAPILWHAMAFLTFLAGALGRRLRFASGSCNELFPNLFTVFVGESGKGKSEAIMLIQKIVMSIKFDDFMGSHQFSQESLFDELLKQSYRMYAFEEFAMWMPKNDASYRYAALKLLITLYDAHHFNENNPLKDNFRTKGGGRAIEFPTVSIIAGCTENQLRGLTEDQMRGGLIGRCLFALGRKKHSIIPVTGSIGGDMVGRVREFFRGVFSTPIRGGQYMQFTDKAAHFWDSHYRDYMTRLERLRYEGDIQTYTSRYAVQVFKIAMLLEACRPRYSWPLVTGEIRIGYETLHTAIVFVDMMRANFLTIFKDELTLGVKSRDGIIQEKIMHYIEQHARISGITKGDIYRHVRDSGFAIDANLNVLVESGRLYQQVKPAKGKKGGRPTMLYFLPKPKEEEIDELKRPDEKRTKNVSIEETGCPLPDPNRKEES